MMKRISRRLAVLALLAPLLAGPVLAQSYAQINGDFRVEGRNPDGSGYSGTARMTELAGAVSMAWQVAGQGYVGRGMRDGRVVTVDWGADTPVVYVVMPNGELHGTWGGGRALERLIPN